MEMNDMKDEIVMAYEMATKMMYVLMEKGMLSMDTQKELYLAYNDEPVRGALEHMCDGFKVTIARYNQTIYLMPDEENEVLGMKLEHLRGIAGSQRTSVTAYLSMYLITMVLYLFYNGVGERLRHRDFVSTGEIVEEVGKRLSEAGNKALVEDEEEEALYNVVSIREHWEGLLEDNDTRRMINSKYGFVRSVINFLERQELFAKFSDEDIRPTKKLNDLMSHHFLDEKRKTMIERLFSAESVLEEV